MAKFKTNDRVTISKESTSRHRGKSGVVKSVYTPYQWGRAMATQYTLSLDDGSRSIIVERYLSKATTEKKVEAKENAAIYAVMGVPADKKNTTCWSETLLTYAEAEKKAVELQETMPLTQFFVMKAIKKTTKPTVLLENV